MNNTLKNGWLFNEGDMDFRQAEEAVSKSVAMYNNARPHKALTFNTIVDPRQLQAELRHIRADGYAMDNEEVEVGLSCVAVPVFSAPGQVSCSISISGMTPRVRTALRGGLLDDLRQASADISRSLYGYQPADDLL